MAEVIYPKKVTLKDDAEIQLSIMNEDDRDAVLSFAQGLPLEDLLFLRVDLTQPDVVDDWINNLKLGHSTSLVAYEGDTLVAYATVHKNPAPWTRRVGEIRVNVAQSFRSRGLGRVMTSAIFDVARNLGLRKLMANMTPDQHGAQSAFRRLGFVPEALLADYVEDRNGTPRDLIIMSHDIDGHSDQSGNSVKVG